MGMITYTKNIFYRASFKYLNQLSIFYTKKTIKSSALCKK